MESLLWWISMVMDFLTRFLEKVGPFIIVLRYLLLLKVKYYMEMMHALWVSPVSPRSQVLHIMEGQKPL